MGDRYILTVECTCGNRDDDVYFAPTCGFIEWKCPKCGNIIDLESYTGISMENASNRDIIEAIVKGVERGI